MPTTRKKKLSWSEKLDRDEGFPKVVPIGPSMTSQWGEGTMVIPAPREVDEIMKRVPEGKLITINEIRAVLARRHGATIGCPMTTGIFAWIAANAAEEDAEDRANEDVTPYWRTLKTGGFLNEKYPGGVSAQKAKLEQEGHRVVQSGKRYTVAGYESALAVDEAED
jgi:alkylated DNA nucleotide flippase Atl1